MSRRGVQEDCSERILEESMSRRGVQDSVKGNVGL
jgi:hypothetical protein